MASRLYSTLRSSILDLLASSSRSREAQLAQPSVSQVLPPLDHTELASQIQHVWSSAQKPEQGAESSSASQVDVVRSALELLGRDIVVSPIASGDLPEPEDDASAQEKCAFQTAVQDRLDVILTLFEVVHEPYDDQQNATPPSPLEPGALLIPILEELVELLSVESWRILWRWVESRSKRFTKNMPASRGKALPLLRIINAFLRFLPRTPDDLVFRGRVHQFASSVISVADKSAINMRGDYNDVKTTWEEAVGKNSAVEDGKQETEDSDVKMEDEATLKADSIAKEGPDFYSTLWSLQEYFSHPPSLDGHADDDGKTPFQRFRDKTDYVLPRMFEQTQKERIMAGKADEGDNSRGSKRKREQMERDLQPRAGFKHPRYLTGKRLLDHELADPSFRRQVLVQYFILFQFLLNLTPASAAKQAFTGGMPKTFVVNADDEVWVKSKISSIREELKRMVPDGQRFEETVLSIITRERHYAQWKNDGCPETVFEVPPMDKADAAIAADKWRKHLEPPPRWPFKVGTKSLSRLWQGGYTSIEQLKSWTRSATIDSLHSEIQAIEVDEEDDAAMGRPTPPEQAAENAEKKTSLNWRALRLASYVQLRNFGHLQSKREIKVLLNAVKEEEERAAIMLMGKQEGEGTQGGEGDNKEQDQEQDQEPEQEQEQEQDDAGDAEAEVEGDAGAEPEPKLDTELEADDGTRKDGEADAQPAGEMGQSDDPADVDTVDNQENQTSPEHSERVGDNGTDLKMESESTAELAQEESGQEAADPEPSTADIDTAEAEQESDRENIPAAEVDPSEPMLEEERDR